jgi:hypothetical protein
MHNLAVAAILVGLTSQPTSDDDAVRLANVEIHLFRSGSRIEAKISNPNDFVVFDVVANCDIKDRHGRILLSSTLTIPDAIQANGTRIIRQVDTQTWPDQAKSADCVSIKLKRLAD